MATLAEVAAAAEKLSLDEQQELLNHPRKRVAARGRERIENEIRESIAEFEAGLTTGGTVDALMQEIRSNHLDPDRRTG